MPVLPRRWRNYGSLPGLLPAPVMRRRWRFTGNMPTSPVRLPRKVAAPPEARSSAPVSSMIANAVTAPRPAPASTRLARASAGRGRCGSVRADWRFLPCRDLGATTESKPTDGNTLNANWPED